MRVLVTGHRGFVGKSLVKALWEKHDVLTTGLCDLTMPMQTHSVIMDLQPDAVIHLAAYARGLGGHKDQHHAYLRNLRINTNVVEAAVAAKVKKFVAMGTVAMYPGDRELLLQENFLLWGPPHKAEYGYAQAKRAMLAQLECTDLDWTMALATNMYGPHDRFCAETGHCVASLVAKFHEKKDTFLPVEVWGDGSQRRDFLHVEDAAAGLVTLLEKGEGLYNLASGESVMIALLVDRLAELSGVDYVYDTTKPVGHKARFVDIEKIKALGWKPQIPLDAGLMQTWNWYLTNRPS
jgi:GDP-L-fucose synthase